VAANKRLRGRLSEACGELGVELIVPPLKWCTDNAAMGAIAVERLKAGLIGGLSLDALPGLVRNG
jgi:N6-L-threonylcarbamoyladenine synthase